MRGVHRRSAPPATTNEGTLQMIVVGVDTHKRSHTLVALDAVFRLVLGAFELI
jgi:hypothetical protein